MIDEDLGPTSRHFVSQRLRLHYLDWGNAAAPPLILLHGGRDHAHSWDWVARALRDRWHVIAPDLRGHGDSAWSPDGAYQVNDFVYDLAQLIHQLAEEPVTIVAHSYGGAIALLYAAIYPERVRRLVAIEAMLPPAAPGAPASRPAPQIWRDWIEERRAIAIRPPRRYASVDDALARMRAANAHLSEAQARHLTVHGVNRNEDGTFSWKFDDLFRAGSPQNMTEAEQYRLWEAVTCPVLLAGGEESWATDPAEDGRLAHFADARVVRFAGAGHWVHHDRLEAFVAELRAFL